MNEQKAEAQHKKDRTKYLWMFFFLFFFGTLALGDSVANLVSITLGYGLNNNGSVIVVSGNISINNTIIQSRLTNCTVGFAAQTFADDGTTGCTNISAGGSNGTITSLIAGKGLNRTTITLNGTILVNYTETQARITGNCGSDAISSINESGTNVTCSSITSSSAPSTYPALNITNGSFSTGDYFFPNSTGINTTSPTATLSVNGNMTIKTLMPASLDPLCRDSTSNAVSTCISSQKYKDNITNLTNANLSTVLESIRTTPVSNFLFNYSSNKTFWHYGLIAEYAPLSLRTTEPNGDNNIDFISSMLGYTWAGIKAILLLENASKIDIKNISNGNLISNVSCPTNNTAQNFSINSLGVVTTQCVPDANASSSSLSVVPTFMNAFNVTPSSVNNTFGFANFTFLGDLNVFGTLSTLLDAYNITNITRVFENTTRLSAKNLTDINAALDNTTKCDARNITSWIYAENITKLDARNITNWLYADNNTRHDASNITSWIKVENITKLDVRNLTNWLYAENNTKFDMRNITNRDNLSLSDVRNLTSWLYAENNTKLDMRNITRTENMSLLAGQNITTGTINGARLPWTNITSTCDLNGVTAIPLAPTTRTPATYGNTSAVCTTFTPQTNINVRNISVLTLAVGTKFQMGIYAASGAILLNSSPLNAQALRSINGMVSMNNTIGTNLTAGNDYVFCLGGTNATGATATYTLTGSMVSLNIPTLFNISMTTTANSTLPTTLGTKTLTAGGFPCAIIGSY